MALPTLDATFASSADLPRKQMLAKWLVEELGETQAPSNVAISGLDEYSPYNPNGQYLYSGTLNSKPRYDKSEDEYIVWSGSTWNITSNNGDVLFSSDEDVADPWLVTTWTAENGGGSPVVTEVPAPSPLSNYYSLPERYLWAKIAVAAGGPKTEADYISLPKNCAWSDIYNAVSGDIARSAITVSGAGSSEANGVYTYRGESGGKPYYNLVGYEDNSGSRAIYWDVDSWLIVDESNNSLYYIPSLIDYPWSESVEVWTSSAGSSPAPTLTPQTPNHTDWSENVALGHIAAAYRGDTANPANLATYIDWPWRYQVASIIGHLMGNYNAIIVSGAGSTEVNGTYTLSGQEDGKNKYVLNDNYVAWTSVDNFWLIFGPDRIRYISTNDTEFPWDAVFSIDDADEPPPTITPTNV